MLSKKSARVLLEWSSVSQRIISVRFKNLEFKKKPSFTYVYVPTKQRSMISTSYFLLQAFVNTVPNLGILLIMGRHECQSLVREFGKRE